MEIDCNASINPVPKERLAYIDIFKGGLILMVVLGHIVYVVGNSTGVQLTASPYCWTRYVASVWIAPYYMAAFFMATGYCSSFKRCLIEQIKTDLKRLVLPAITIPLIMRIVTPPLSDINLEMLSFIYQDKLPWFLLAMFEARLIYKLFTEIKCKKIFKFIIFAVISMLSCCLVGY